ncbi:hypothetical protein SLL00_06110 [Metabacillus indicus]|uniref:hypothetical protein n=1 Tax=Metabacillus indicus TaxID=246786 RepID=UPI002A056DE5|nr:hypothetical protein [Metabacillus indicus]MDX8289356.1 hypothetical protein [Metabacillus indicus]
MQHKEQRSNAFLILTGILFLFSMLTFIIPIPGLLKDAVFLVGFITACIIHFYFKRKQKETA